MPYDPLTVWEWEGGAIGSDDEVNLEDVAGAERSERGDQDAEPPDAQAAGRGRPVRGAIERIHRQAPTAESGRDAMA